MYIRQPTVYLLYQEATRKVYIDSSTTPDHAVYEHLLKLSRGIHRDLNLQELYDQDPNFYHVYYTVSSEIEAYDLNQALFDYYQPTGLLINASP